eukprot:g5312.t1
MEALRGLTIPLPLDNGTGTCAKKKTGFCDPGYDDGMKEAEEKSSVMYLFLFPAILMGEMVFLFVTKRDVKTESISFGGRFYKLYLVGYELFEVPTQLYALNVKAATNELQNGVIMTATALISINMIVTPTLVYFDATAATLLIVDAALDTCAFLLNTAVIGASPEDLLTDISIWLPAVSLSGIILIAFQPQKLEQKDIERGGRESIRWIENISIVSSSKSVGRNIEHETGSAQRKSFGTVVEMSVRKALGGRMRQITAVATFACLGVLLFTTTLIRGSVQYHACIEEHGEGWTCAIPQVHFEDGLFGRTSCATGRVRSLSCAGVQFAKLPQMRIFEDVTTIDVSGNKRLASLPYELLHVSKERNLKISATGSPAYHNIDWSYTPDFQMIDSKALGRICQQIECERIALPFAERHPMTVAVCETRKRIVRRAFRVSTGGKNCEDLTSASITYQDCVALILRFYIMLY